MKTKIKTVTILIALIFGTLTLAGCDDNGSNTGRECWRSDFASADDNLELISVEDFEDGIDDHINVTVRYTLQSSEEAYLALTCIGNSSGLSPTLITRGTDVISMSRHYQNCEPKIVELRISPEKGYCDHYDQSLGDSCFLYCKFNL